ncbi:MAG: hypothetical protein JXQ82_00795 [Methanomicrobiaceae archaeon]|nr:hypothetical protein [Methanomicrobiaceae archaeon]
MKNRYIIILAAFFVISVLFCPVSAQAGTYAKGDTVSITGTATGSPQEGLAVWVFGPNYWTREIQTVSGDSYTYEIPGSVTGNMASGQYFCIVQHPMYNGVFDADLVSGAQTQVKSSAGPSFVIEGSGRLQGSSAAYALMNMLDSPDIDDTYTVTEFFISEPWIRFTPEETYYSGDTILISGRTNIAAGEKLLYELYSASFAPTSKSSSSGFSGKSGYTEIIPAYPDNTWEILIDTAGMIPDVYIFKISGEDSAAAYSAEFTLAEERPVETVSMETPTDLITLDQEVSLNEEMPTSAPAAGAGVIIVIISLASVFLIYALKRS